MYSNTINFKVDLMIDLSKLLKPSTISSLGKNAGISGSFAYIFRRKSANEIMKIGISEGVPSSNMWLERIYRQAGHIPGWIDGGPFLRAGSGSDMGEVCRSHFPDIHKDDVEILVEDHFRKSYKDLVIRENELVQEHIKQYGYPPKGNIQPTRRNRRGVGTRRTLNSLSLFQRYFEEPVEHNSNNRFEDLLN